MILDFIKSDIDDTFYFVTDAGILYKQDGNIITKVIAIPVADMALIYIMTPYMFITEKYGLNAYLINLSTLTIKKFSREDYYSDQYIYSAAFIRHEGKVLLIHQTMWNRLDIYDIANEKNLTEREIICEQVCDNPIKFRYKNYIDYFHGRIHPSPNFETFITNGWVWQPMGLRMYYNVAEFIEKYEECSKEIFYYCDDWDLPVCFIDSNTVAMAVDDGHNDLFDNDDDEYIKEYRQIVIYDIATKDATQKLTLDVDVFSLGHKIDNSMEYCSSKDMLVCIGPKGCYLCTLAGVVQKHTLPADSVKFDRLSELFYYYSTNKIEWTSISELIGLTK